MKSVFLCISFISFFINLSARTLGGVPLPRNKRSIDACPVHPDTPVILDGKETYFDFDQNEPEPAPLEGEDDNLTCPAQFGDWWPGAAQNLKASCPWSWTTYDTWNVIPDIYPRYVKQAKCLCETCVNAQAMGCKELRREFQFYRKTGCSGNKPVLVGGKLPITVGCFCSKG